MKRCRITPCRMKQGLLHALVVACLGSWLLTACAGNDVPTRYDYQVVETRPHDTRLFTQGLLIQDALFYESGGRYGQSRLVAYAERADQPERQHRLPSEYFAEGLTEMDGRLYLLTWRESTLLVFDRDSFEPLGERHYRGEGWGLTDDGKHLIRSDGSSRLFFHHPDTFEPLHHITVTERGKPVPRLNELEYVDGYIWANVWHSNRLVQIDPDTGDIAGSLDLSGLVRREKPASSESVLNGIAYDEQRGHWWVTGKRWRRLYRLELKPPVP